MDKSCVVLTIQTFENCYQKANKTYHCYSDSNFLLLIMISPGVNAGTNFTKTATSLDHTFAELASQGKMH